MKKSLVFCVILVCHTFMYASMDPLKEWAPIVQNQMPDKFVSANLQKLDGLLGERITINLQKRLLKIDSAILLSGFKKRPGSQVWIGEHVGKFLFSAALTYKYTRDPSLKRLMDEMVAKYSSYQLADGYLGTYLPKDYWSEWDVWAHKYCIIGLLNYYSITGDPKALSTAKRAADLICKTFGTLPGQRDLIASGHHVGMASGSILEPMVDLYRYTGDNKYLDFAKYIISAWEQPNGPKILSAIEKHGQVTKVGNGKAYEMMSCFVGIAKFARLTGNDKYLQLLETAWKDIRLYRMYITGTASSYEHFKEEYILPADNDAHMGEGCVTTTWIQYNYQLLLMTGNIRYAEEMERAVYNHLFAAENPLSGCVSYYTALQGPKPHKCDQGFSCCLSSIPRGISMIPDMVWGKLNGNFTILMYEGGKVRDSITAVDGTKIDLNIMATSAFPQEGSIIYKISPSMPGKRFSINFRVPSWSSGFIAKVNGETYKGTAGEILNVNRTWSDKDEIQIRFDMPLQIISGGVSYPNAVAIKRGPQILAVDASLNKDLSSIADIRFSPSYTPSLTAASNILPKDWSWKQAYQLSMIVNNKNKSVMMVPFADAGQSGADIAVWLKTDTQIFK